MQAFSTESTAPASTASPTATAAAAIVTRVPLCGPWWCCWGLHAVGWHDGGVSSSGDGSKVKHLLLVPSALTGACPRDALHAPR
jgi:hypothetical protein